MGERLRAASRYGVWSVFVWVSLLNKFYPAGGLGWRPNYVGITLGFLLILAVGVLRRRAEQAGKPPVGARADGAVDFLASLGMAGVGAALVCFRHFDLAPRWCAAVLLAAGFLLGWLYVRWACYFTVVGLGRALRYLCVGFLVWIGFQTVLGAIPALVQQVLTVAIPLLSCAMLGTALKDEEGSEPTEGWRFAMANLVSMGKAWAAIITASLAVSITVSLSVSEGSSVSLLASRASVVLIAALFVWLVLGRRLMLEFASVWRIVFFVLAPGVAVALVNPESPLLHAFALSAWDVLIPIIWITICDIARHSSLHPYTVVGAGMCMYTLPFAVGTPLYHVLVGTVDRQVVVAALFLLLYAVMGLCLGTRDPDTQRIFEDLREGLPQPAEFATIDEKCQALGVQRGLSERQVEIMKMVCKGRPRAYIAETLFITENTVKTHLSRLYAKLDVHSQKELLDLIDAAL